MAPFTFKEVKGTEDLKKRLQEGVFDSDYMRFVRDVGPSLLQRIVQSCSVATLWLGPKLGANESLS